MKRLFAGIICVIMAVVIAGCGGDTQTNGNTGTVQQLSPDSLITAETASSLTGTTMRMTEDGVVNDNGTLTVTYVTDPIGQGDSVSVSIRQFSDTVSSSVIWSDYEQARIKRTDMEYVEGIGGACYIAYPYINVYDRGCHIRISAGSGNSENQKNLLINLAATAAIAVENTIPAELVEQSSDNVIK